MEGNGRAIKKERLEYLEDLIFVGYKVFNYELLK